MSDGIAADGGSYGEIDPQGHVIVTHFDLDDYPHFWLYQNYLISYIGHDGQVIDQLTNAFGAQFAGGAFYDTVLEMLTASEWVLTDWGTPVEGTAAVPAITRIRFQDGMMSGSTGINDFGVPFWLTEDDPAENFHLALDELFVTKKTGQDPLVNNQEAIFLQALASADHIAVAPEVMRISYEGGYSLGFAAAAP